MPEVGDTAPDFELASNLEQCCAGVLSAGLDTCVNVADACVRGRPRTLPRL